MLEPCGDVTEYPREAPAPLLLGAGFMRVCTEASKMPQPSLTSGKGAHGGRDLRSEKDRWLGSLEAKTCPSVWHIQSLELSSSS